MTLSGFNALIVKKYNWHPGALGANNFEWRDIKPIIESKGIDEAVNYFKAHRESLAAGEKAAFQRKTCAMSARGSSAYADNWN